jgi:hypothetical protein
MKTNSLRILSRVLFFLGVAMGLALAVVAIWNNLESTHYYFRGVKHAPFPGLQCPLMIAPTEKGRVTAVFHNPNAEEDNFLYRAEISGKSSMTRQVEGEIAVPPHGSKSIRLTVDANDVDLLFFILVKLTILPNAIHPSQEAICGMLVIDVLGLTGTQITIIALLLSLFGIAIGWGLWQRTGGKARRDMPRVVQALGIVVISTMSTAYMGWWVLAIALSVIAFLLILISLRFAVAE